MTRRARIEALQRALESVDMDYPQMADITQDVASYVFDGILDPERHRPAFFRPIISVHGLGKSSYVTLGLAKALGIAHLVVPYHCKEGEPFLPIDTLKELAKHQPDPVFGLRGILLIEEVQNVVGPDKEPDYDAIYKKKYDETFKRLHDEAVANWRKEQAQQRQTELLAVLKQRSAPQKSEGGGHGGGGGGGKQKGGQQPPPQVEYIPPPPPPPMPLDEIARIFSEATPPDYLKIDAAKTAAAEAQTEKEDAQKNWDLFMNRTQRLREAFSGSGDMASDDSAIDGVIHDLKVIASDYAKALLEGRDEYRTRIKKARREKKAAQEALAAFGDPKPFEEAAAKLAEKERLTKQLDSMTAPSSEATEGTESADASAATDEVVDEDEEREPPPPPPPPTSGSRRDRKPRHAQPTPRTPPKALPPDQAIARNVETRLAAVEQELLSLPSAEKVKPWDVARDKLREVSDRLSKLEAQYEALRQGARKTLKKALEEKQIATNLLTSDPQLAGTIPRPAEADALENLLLDEQFLTRVLSRRPVQTVRDLLAKVKGRPKQAVLSADGILVFALGNHPEWDEMINKNFKNHNDPDARLRVEEDMRTSADGVALVQSYVLKRLGRFNPEAGSSDPNILSLLSRLGGIEHWFPRRSLSKPQWDVLISSQLKLAAMKWIILAEEDYGLKLESIEFEPTMHELIYGSGAIPNSDLRVFHPRLKAALGPFRQAMLAMLPQNPNVKNIRVSYNAAAHQMEFYFLESALAAVAPPSPPTPVQRAARIITTELDDPDAIAEAEELEADEDIDALAAAAGVTAPPQAPLWRHVYSVPYRPNTFLNTPQAETRITGEEYELIAFREAARVFMGTLLHASAPSAQRILVHTAFAPTEYWERPQRREPWWRFALADIMVRLAGVRAEITFESGAEQDHVTKEMDSIKVLLEQRFEEFKKRRLAPGSPGADSPHPEAVQMFRELLPDYVVTLPVVNALKNNTSKAGVFALADSLVTLLLGYEDSERVLETIAGDFRTRIDRNQPVDPSVIVTAFEEFFSEAAPDLMGKVRERRPGSIDIKPPKCAFRLAVPPPPAELPPPKRLWWPQRLYQWATSKRG